MKRPEMENDIETLGPDDVLVLAEWAVLQKQPKTEAGDKLSANPGNDPSEPAKPSPRLDGLSGPRRDHPMLKPGHCNVDWPARSRSGTGLRAGSDTNYHRAYMWVAPWSSLLLRARRPPHSTDPEYVCQISGDDPETILPPSRTYGQREGLPRIASPR
jgi:hypothetical protein